jgi:hypothetical protein
MNCKLNFFQLGSFANLNRYGRGWRYHMPTSIWISGESVTPFNPRENPPTAETPWLRGTVVIFDFNKFERTQLFNQALNPVDFEATRTVAQVLREQQAQSAEDKRNQVKDLKSPSNDSHLIPSRGGTASVLSSRS